MIQIIQARDFDRLAGHEQVFAEIVDIETGEEIEFLIKYFFMDGDREIYKTTKFKIKGDPTIQEIAVMHTKEKFSLAGKEDKGPYKIFSDEFSEEVYNRIISYLNREIVLAESRD